MRSRALLKLVSIVAVAACSLLAAGCGGGGSPVVAGVASSTASPATPTQDGATATKTGTIASALAFARCMRSHGIPGWPDPDTRGFFDKAKLRPLELSESRVRTLEEGPCNIELPSLQGTTITPADRADYLRAAACMRSHGFPDFPDPTFPGTSVKLTIPSSINENSSKFKSAATTCTKLIRPGLPYTRPRGS